MLEIILLFYLSWKIGILVKAKGYKPLPWKIRVWLAWLGSEMGILFIAMGFFGIRDLYILYPFALAGAATGYLIVRQKARQLPVKTDREDWLDQTGSHE